MAEAGSSSSKRHLQESIDEDENTKKMKRVEIGEILETFAEALEPVEIGKFATVDDWNKLWEKRRGPEGVRKKIFNTLFVLADAMLECPGCRQIREG
jgi:hypothetical protein